MHRLTSKISGMDRHFRRGTDSVAVPQHKFGNRTYSLKVQLMARKLALLVALSILASNTAYAQADPIEAKLIDAKTQFEKSVEEAKSSLLDRLQKKAADVMKAGNLELLEAIHRETKALEQTGTLPKTVPTKGFESKMKPARMRMERGYAEAIKNYTKVGNIDLAKKMQQELAHFKQAATVATAVNVLTDDAITPRRIVVDASKDGGVWWFPQGENGFDPTKDHQGKRLADYLKSCGWTVEEIARDEDITARLTGATLVIRASLYGKYQPSDVRAYREYVADGGNVLLLRGFVRDGAENHDLVAREFGVVFSNTVRTESITRWAKHSLTMDLDLLPYNIGSVVTESPKATVPLAYLDKNRLVMGIVERGKGKVLFMSTILPLLKVPQPFVERVLNELACDD